MLILGVLFQCVDTACLLAAVISAARRPFVCPPGKRKESLAYQRGFEPSSDMLACYVAAGAFEERLSGQRRGFGDDQENTSADRFAGERFLVPQRLRALLRSRDSLREELVRARLIEHESAASRRRHQPGANGNWEGGENQTGGENPTGDGQNDDDADVGGWGAWEDEAPNHDSWGYQSNTGSWWWDQQQQQWDPKWHSLHAHDHEKELRTALLVAASPVNVAMRRRPFLAKHRTPTGLEAIVAPQSVNAQQRPGKGGGGGKEQDRRGGPSWWAYGSMQISNKQGFLRTTTLVDPYHIILFGGLGVEHRREATEGRGKQPEEEASGPTVEGLEWAGPLTLIDDWIELQGSEDTIYLLSYLRSEIRRCIHLKVLDPSGQLPESTQWLLDEVATGVLRTATRRQNRTLWALPQQLVLPPGGSVPNDAHGGFGGYGGGHKGGGKDRVGGWGKGKGEDRWGGGGKGKGKGGGKGGGGGGSRKGGKEPIRHQ